jgi:hypothetical protein
MNFIKQDSLLSPKGFFLMSTEIDPTTTGPGRREIGLGLLFGVCGLIGAAVFLSVADPYLRDPDGAVFSFSALFNLHK